HSGNAALPEAAWNKDAVELTKLHRFVVVFEALGFDPMNFCSQIVDESAVNESLAKALVRIFELHIFPNDANRNFIEGVMDSLNELFPIFHAAFGLGQMEV